MTLLVDPPPPRDRGGQRQSTQRSAVNQLDGAQLGPVPSTTQLRSTTLLRSTAFRSTMVTETAPSRTALS